MTEVPHSREHHGDALLVGGGDDFFIADAASGLDDGGGAGAGGGEHTVGKGEEGIGGAGTALCARRVPSGGGLGVLGFARRNPRAVNAAHLARANAGGGSVFHIDNRV